MTIRNTVLFELMFAQPSLLRIELPSCANLSAVCLGFIQRHMIVVYLERAWGRIYGSLTMEGAAFNSRLQVEAVLILILRGNKYLKRYKFSLPLSPSNYVTAVTDG